jgi:PAS domain S-box-containing protein
MVRKAGGAAGTRVQHARAGARDEAAAGLATPRIAPVAHPVFGTDDTTRGRAEAAQAELAGERAERERLLAHEHLLSAIVESSDDAIIAETLEGAVSSWNAAAERLFGYTETEILGQPVAVLDPPDRPAELPALLERLHRGERIEHYETVQVRKDGTPVDVSLSLSPVHDGDGRVIGTATIACDNTDHKRAERVLREHAALLDLVPAAVLVRDLGDTVTFWSPAAERTYGWTAEQARGQIAHTLLQTRFQDPQAVVEPALLAGGYWEGELRHTRRDGTAIVVASRQALQRDERGRPVAILEINTDITERRQAEERLRLLSDAGSLLASSLDEEAMCERLAALAVPRLADWAAVDLLDADGRLRRLMVAHSDPSKVALGRVMWGDQRVDVNSTHPLATALRTGTSRLDPHASEATLAAWARDAQQLDRLRRLGLRSIMLVPIVVHRPALGVVSLATAESGRRFGPMDLELAEELARRAALAIDHARMYAAEQLARAEAEAAVQVRDAVLASVSHDLKNPLAVIQGQAHLLERMVARHDPPVADRLVTGLRRIDSAATRMARWIDELLDATRLAAGQELTLEPTITDLVALVRGAAAERQQTAARHVLRVETDGAKLVGLYDEGRLRRVLDNLLSNAVKYSPQGGEIAITTGRQTAGGAAWAVLRVRDQGLGIPAADQARIFERFRRGGNVARIAGTGIGLAGARLIVEQHGGRIELESREGWGTTFAIWLPLTVAARSGATHRG